MKKVILTLLLILLAICIVGCTGELTDSISSSLSSSSVEQSSISSSETISSSVSKEESSSSESSSSISSAISSSSSSSEEVVCVKLSVSGQKTTFLNGEDFSTGSLVVVAQMSDGTSKTLTDLEYVVDSSAYNCMQAKSYEVTITANGTSYKKSYSVTVNVADKLKVLMIGNSFADDTIAHSYEVATALGIAPDLCRFCPSNPARIFSLSHRKALFS